MATERGNVLQLIITFILTIRAPLASEPVSESERLSNHITMFRALDMLWLRSARPARPSHTERESHRYQGSPAPLDGLT